MENRINQIMKLENGEQYFIIKQAYYKGSNYYVSAKLTENGEEMSGEFTVFEEVDYNGRRSVVPVKDQNTRKLIVKYVGL